MGAQRATAQQAADLPGGFGVAVVREDGKWRCTALRRTALNSLTAAETELRELRSAGAVFGLLDVDEEFLIILRPAPAGTRLLLSDATAALDYDIAAEVLDTLKLEGDEATGAAIVKVAVEAPLKQIAANAGLEGGVVVDRVRNLPTGEGLNAATGEYVNLLAAGIADPVKVTRSALQNAGSIAGLFLTTEAVVADKPEPPAAPADGGAGDMGGMY